MNKKQHIKIGMVVGIIGGIYILTHKYKKKKELQKEDFFETGVFFLFSVMGAHIPDIIEPAKHPHHRKIFHSKSILLTNIYFLCKNNNENKMLKYIINGFLVGYCSHLLADSSTPRGLPFV